MARGISRCEKINRPLHRSLTPEPLGFGRYYFFIYFYMYGDGFGYGMSYGMYGGFGFIFDLLWAAFIIALIVAAVRFSRRENWTHFGRRTPVDILKERYAKGEIDKEEFEQRRRDLER